MTGCNFTELGGNAVVFSNHVQGSAITGSEFYRIGDNAVAFIGSTVADDGSAPTYPNKNLVARNAMHEIGLYGKQTSCFITTLAANTTLESNVCFNGPRAGFNYNDGFGGGNVMRGNLAFNMVRETGDHGCVLTHCGWARLRMDAEEILHHTASNDQPENNRLWRCVCSESRPYGKWRGN